MLHARDAGELVGISHEKRVETSIVEFLYLYFPLSDLTDRAWWAAFSFSQIFSVRLPPWQSCKVRFEPQ
jgi:hypothetical protein